MFVEMMRNPKRDFFSSNILFTAVQRWPMQCVINFAGDSRAFVKWVADNQYLTLKPSDWT